MWPPRFWADVRYCWAFNATECAACGRVRGLRPTFSACLPSAKYGSFGG